MRCAPASAAQVIARTRTDTSVANCRSNILHSEEIDARTLLANCRGHGGAVADAIRVVSGVIRDQRRSALNATDVRMDTVHAAVQHGDDYSSTSSVGEGSISESEAHAVVSVHGLKRAARKETGERGCALAEEIVGRAFFNDATLLEDDDAVGATGKIQPVCDDDRRPASHHGLVAGGDLSFRGRIQRARCLVEHEHRWIGNECACERYTLSNT